METMSFFFPQSLPPLSFELSRIQRYLIGPLRIPRPQLRACVILNTKAKAVSQSSGPNEVFADFKLGIFGNAPMSLFPRVPGS